MLSGEVRPQLVRIEEVLLQLFLNTNQLKANQLQFRKEFLMYREFPSGTLLKKKKIPRKIPPPKNYPFSKLLPDSQDLFNP